MPRPKLDRIISDTPVVEGFRPIGIQISDQEPVMLLFEEYESIRLMDYEGLNQEQSSQLMDVSRPTFTRIYEKARRAVAKAFVEGKPLFIEGGNYHTCNESKCPKCRKREAGEMCCRREKNQITNKGVNYENCCTGKRKCN